MRYFIVFILIFGFSACQNVKLPEKPKNLIAKDKMVDCLTEAYLANAARSVNNRTILDKGIVADSMIYKKFGIDSLQFVKSNAFYAADVNTYMDMFKQVEARLTKMQVRLDSIQEIDKRRKDSVSKSLNVERINEKLAKDSLI